MATASTKSRALTPEENAEFLQQLSQGGELLKAGKVTEAKDYLERAHQLQPRNDKGQNLLGLTYFKLGQFDRAAEIYEALVRDNPADPTLRVNLGLVYLKANALQRAVREFETATDLAPEHKKSHNYLGLALAQAGEYARAKEHFVLAGSDAMAEKMARAIAGEPFQTPAPPSVNGTEAPRAINGSGKHLTGENEDQEQGGAYVGTNGAHPPPEEQTSAQSEGEYAAQTDAAPADPAQEESHAAQGELAEPPASEAQSDEWQHQAEQPLANGHDPESGEWQQQPLSNGHDPYPPEAGAGESAYANGVDANGQWTNGHDHAYSNGADPHYYESYPAQPAADTAEQEIPVAGMMEAEEPPSAAPMANDDWGQQADPASAPPSDQNPDGEPRSEELPVYDLAADDGILAKEEDETGIRAGTGIEASFMPDPGASEIDGGTPKPPTSDEAYAQDPYAETYHALAVAPPPEAAYEDPFADAPPDASYAQAHADRTQMHGQPLVPTAPAYEHGTEHNYAQLSVERPPLDSTPVPPRGYLQQALERSRPPLAEDPTTTAPSAPQAEGAIFSHVAGRSRLIDGELRGPFNLKQDSVTIVVQGEVLTRLTGLLAITGQVEFAPVRKRFRGRVTERDFGAGEEQVMRATGQGVLVLENKGQTFQSSDLNDESAYFREDVVFAFEEPVVYENGNVPSDVAPDVQLVHLRGKGQVLLSLPGPMRSLEVKQGHPVTLPLGHLVGWYGNLSPRVIALVSDGKGKALKAGVELSGEGFALLAVPLR